MKSRQSILIATGNLDGLDLKLSNTDPLSTCKKVNENIYNNVLAMIPKEKKDFYLNHGDQYTFGLDVDPIVQIGYLILIFRPAWLYSPLQYNEKTSNDGKRSIDIVSPRFVTENNPILPIEKFAGQHYCKV
jgi:hypothetical protein